MFFQRVLEPHPPREPIEGMLKVLYLSQIITVPLTLTTDFDDPKQLAERSIIINTIHFAALLIGFVWGTFNLLNDREQPNLR